MERSFKKFLSLSLLVSAFGINAAITQSVTPRFTIRPQGANALRRMVQSVGHTNIYDMDKIYGTVAATFEYSRSFDGDKIAECLFGDALNGCGLNIQGSRVTDRTENALLADYFYLPTDYNSKVTVDPRIQNFTVDLYGYLGFDEWVSGLHGWVQLPINWTKWSLGWSEKATTTGSADHDAGYFTSDVLPRASLVDTASRFFDGSQAPDTVTQDGLTTTFAKLCCGRIASCDDDSETTVPEVRFGLGWNFLQDEDYSLGIGAQVAAPTGKQGEKGLLFSAQNGTKNWEFGGNISGHFILWRSEEETQHFGLYLDANLTHVFKHEQNRCFDLCGKPLSRYMLAMKFTDSTTTSNLKGGATAVAATAPASQFGLAYAPVANLTATTVDVSVGVSADVVAMFNYTNGGWNWDLGYNLWARSCEKLRTNCECTTPFAEDTWVLKGDATVYGFDKGTAGTGAATAFVPLSATQSEATINGGTNFGFAGDAVVATARANPKIDTPVLAFATNNNPLQFSRPGTVAGQVNTSATPVFIKGSDINYARTKGISHKLFSDFGYAWVDHENWIPYVSVGFEVEFATHDDSSCNDSCEPCSTTTACDTSCNTSCSDNSVKGDCLKCGVSQWGVWLKGGLSFN